MLRVLKELRPMVVERGVALVELRLVVCGGFSARVEVLKEPPPPSYRKITAGFLKFLVASALAY